MEYRLYERNNIKTSFIGVDYSNFVFTSQTILNNEYQKIFDSLSLLKVNFITIAQNNFQFIQSLIEWENKNKVLFKKSILIGLTDNQQNFLSKSKMKEFIYENRFENLEDKVSKLVVEQKLTKIDFLTLLYPKNVHFSKLHIEKLIPSLKERKLIESFGVRCQNSEDALIISKKYDIDHIEIELDINASTEVLNSIFKISNMKKIAVFSILKDSWPNKSLEPTMKPDHLESLLLEGNDNFEDDLRSKLEGRFKNLTNFAIRKLKVQNFQSIIIPLNTQNLVFDDFQLLFLPGLTHTEEIAYQQSFEPAMYVSPKKHD